MYDIDYHKPYILVALSSLAPMSFIQYLEVTIAWGFAIYSHPDRQGAPNRPHRKGDDIYSFGVLLSDIGLWQLASDALGREKSTTRFSPVGTRDKLLENSRRRLSHYIGTFYAHAVDTCISGDPKFDLDDKAQY